MVEIERESLVINKSGMFSYHSNSSLHSIIFLAQTITPTHSHSRPTNSNNVVPLPLLIRSPSSIPTPLSINDLARLPPPLPLLGTCFIFVS